MQLNTYFYHEWQMGHSVINMLDILFTLYAETNAT
jgi:hypothetical protein